MKKILLTGIIAFVLASCGNSSQGDQSPAAGDTKSETAKPDENEKPPDIKDYDPKRGEGKFTHVEVSLKLDVVKAEAGNKIFSVKCGACHKLTEEKLVGPGWKGVTSRHSPEWIMNFTTNPDAMLDKDPKAQAMLEICLVRMPNQNLSDDEARALYEYMRKNDGVK